MEFEEKTLNSEIAFKGKVVTVLKDDVLLCDNSKSYREVVLHNGGVVIVALKEDKILMVNQYRYPIRTVNIELPAGKLEQGENPDDAATRELEEETGYRAKIWKSLGFINTTPGICSEKLYLYYATDLEFVGQHLDVGEILQCLEIKVSDALDMIKNGEINDAKTICALTRAFCKEFIYD